MPAYEYCNNSCLCTSAQGSGGSGQAAAGGGDEDGEEEEEEGGEAGGAPPLTNHELERRMVAMLQGAGARPGKRLCPCDGSCTLRPMPVRTAEASRASSQQPVLNNWRMLDTG